MTNRIPPRACYRATLAAVRLRLGMLDLRCRLARAHVHQRVDNAIGIASAAALLLPLAPSIGVLLVARRWPRACEMLLTVWIGYVGIYYSGAADMVRTGWAHFVVHTAFPIALLWWAFLAAEALKGLERDRDARELKAKWSANRLDPLTSS